jgi:hypothetical protein
MVSKRFFGSVYEKLIMEAIMKKGSVRILFSLPVLSTLLFTGCNAPKSHLAKFNSAFRSDYMSDCSFVNSSELARSKISKSEKPKGEDLLWSMQLGCIDRIEKDYEQSNAFFDKAEEMLNYFDYQNVAVDSAASIAVSDNIVPYLGEEYDGIMINTYKALNFMALGDNDLARVEFNRALDRQRRAKEKFAKEIAKVKEEMDKEEGEKKSRAEQNVENPKIDALITEKYPGIYEFQAYPDFVNPFTTYMAGVFFNLVGDPAKAVTFLKESYGMVSDNKYVAEDIAVTEDVLDGKGQLKDTVWVVFENGMGPVKEEFKIDLPLFIATNKVKYIGFALPRLELRQQAYPYLSVRAGEQAYDTQIVADMDRVIRTEFKKDFKNTLTRAIISTTTKSVAQYALQKSGDYKTRFLTSGLAAIYSFATTAADVRIWTTLPKDFQVARFPMPADRMVVIEPPGAEPVNVEIPPCNNALIYIKIPFAQARPVYDLITY